MTEPDGRQPEPSREASLVWFIAVVATIVALVSLAFPLAQGIKATAQTIEQPK